MVPHRPDPSMGLFETLLVWAGEPVALAEHLTRLDAGLAAVFGSGLPGDAAALVHDVARGLDLGRLRLTAVATPPPATEGDPSLRASTAERWDRAVGQGAAAAQIGAEGTAIDPEVPMPAWEDGARLSSFELLDGLGTYKWRDRSVLPDEAKGLPLILDRGAEVLEASRASVFVVHDGALFTPPLDGRILPGTTRATVLAIAAEAGLEATERRIGREELLGADEVFLSGSVRGVEPARSLDGEQLGRGEVTAVLADRLAARWGLPAPAPR
ncbi:MAG: aminotransferase class IV [Solirubrobacterales bacterium]